MDLDIVVSATTESILTSVIAVIHSIFLQASVFF